LSVRPYDIWFDIESVALRDFADSLDTAGRYKVEETLIPSPSGPENLFVLSSDGALKVGTPCLRLRIEIQRAEGDIDFRCPAAFVPSNTNDPDAIPRAILRRADVVCALCCDELSITHRSGRIDFEEVSTALIEIWIENPHQAVIGV